MRVVHELYAAQRALPDPISYMGQASQIFCEGIRNAVSANVMPQNNCYAFSSDGVSEKFLDGTFADVSGNAALTLSKFILSPNRTEQAPADYNANLILAEEVQVYMAD
ncbi:hypothetical protein HGRIS_001463 [Hohenbuehelia grisea]|uniref:Uncharacterized protein n=1 Tax=Hohenbuehelia grisea TaxID=104357 RepID=A0ABR3JQE4_9AGAR